MNDFIDDIQSHWGDLTRDEVLTHGKSLESLSDYIATRYGAPVDEVQSTLQELQQNHMGGHPKLNDHFAGTDRAQRDTAENGIITDARNPDSLEWQAREDINRNDKRSDRTP